LNQKGDWCEFISKKSHAVDRDAGYAEGKRGAKLREKSKPHHGNRQNSDIVMPGRGRGKTISADLAGSGRGKKQKKGVSPGHIRRNGRRAEVACRPGVSTSLGAAKRGKADRGRKSAHPSPKRPHKFAKTLSIGGIDKTD